MKVHRDKINKNTNTNVLGIKSSALDSQTFMSNNDLKYSELLLKVIEPFMAKVKDFDELDDLITIGVLAWNISNVKEFFPAMYPQYLNLLEKDSVIDKDDRKFVEVLIQRKESIITNDKIFIKDYEISEDEKGKPKLTVVCIREQEFLSEIINSDVDDLDDDSFDTESGFINRNAIVIKPRQPFLDWLKKINAGFTIQNQTIYLMKEVDNIERAEKWLKKNFEEIFVNELDSYGQYQNTWPANRTYKMFNEWFSHEIISMIYDLEEIPITKF